MHVQYSTEAFRHNPKLGVALGAILLCIGSGGFIAEYGDYQSLGKDPQSVTVEQAVPAPASVTSSARFVRLSGKLSLDCNQVLEERSNGVVTGVRVLASDSAHERWFYLRLKGNPNCASVSLPMTGILKKADSALPAWLQEKGITVPASSFPLMELSADEGPGDVAFLLWVFVGIAALGLVLLAYFVRLKPGMSVRKPVAMGRAAGR